MVDKSGQAGTEIEITEEMLNRAEITYSRICAHDEHCGMSAKELIKEVLQSAWWSETERSESSS